MASGYLRAFKPTAVAVVGAALSLASVSSRATEPSEPPVGAADRDGDYLRLVHQRIHTSWVDGFIRVTPYDELGPATSRREVELKLTVRWDGTIEAAEVGTSSGSPDFDAAALNSIWTSAPFPPPTDVMADDGLAHIKWRFARDFRLCSGAEIVRVEYPLAIALPNLMARGLWSEAARRLDQQLDRVGWSDGDFLSPFVRQWLARPNLSDDLDTRAAAALALGGDRQQIDRLQAALLSPTTAGIAAPTLHRLGVNVGARLAAALSDNSNGDSMRTRQAVVAAIRAEPAVAAHCPPCVAAFAAAALDPRQSIGDRVAMIATLGDFEHTPVVTLALGAASKDANAGIRAAGLLAAIPPGLGRVGIIHMAPLLHDRAPELRAAAAAGVLRAGGDLGLEQLYLLAREKDPRPLVAAATELGKMDSEASASLLGKWLKRSDKTVRRAVIQALAHRHDEPARALVEPILQAAATNSSEDLAVRELALHTVHPDQVSEMATSDPRLGRAAYRVLLAAELRQEAAHWLLTHLGDLGPPDRIAAMGEWIAESPKLTARN